MARAWNEVRRRAIVFSKKWRDAGSEKGESQSFYDDFFKIFGVERWQVARYEQKVKKLGHHTGFIDLLWPKVLLVEQKSAGSDLREAYKQASEYFDFLPVKDRPRYILVSDFQTFELHDRAEDTDYRFALPDLSEHVERFGFIMGVQQRAFVDQDPANIKAAELVGRFHDMLRESGYTGHALERFLVRIVFCLFADDTGIFDARGMFFQFLEDRTSEDGADLGPWLAQLFQVLDTPEEDRSGTLDEDLARFPYINGDLFSGHLPIPSFTSPMREALLDACRFDWSEISPAIFGALFQSVMDPKQRRAQGAHYTTEKNILKVMGPLFMDDLNAEFARLKARKDGRRVADLKKFQEQLGKLNFFDPACGCGNFLIIAYRELRLLEIQVIKEIHAAQGNKQQVIDVGLLSLVDVSQFYGIELNEFPARIAETALWMMDHLMNILLSNEFGETYARIPLTSSPHILHADALEVDWSTHLPPEDCSFVFGNPPFLGAKTQSTHQRQQVRKIARLRKSGGTLDYVAAWFIKAGEYLTGRCRIGFVATNSLTQGEQVAQLWPILFQRCGLEIAFAHRTFAWGSDARGSAHVHVVILGLDRRENVRGKRRLFTYPDINGDPVESVQTTISPYLFDASGLSDPYLTVRSETAPINGLHRLRTGVQMIDNGILTFDDNEMKSFLAAEPGAAPFFRRYIGGDEFINGSYRWILYLRNGEPADLKRLPLVAARVSEVRAYRSASRRQSTRRMADYPTLVGVDERLEANYLVIPNTSSERRSYIPIGWLGTDVIANQKLRILPNATLRDFALLTSAMHMAWMRTISGRMKSDYMYSVGIVYNTFPTPPADANLSRLDGLAQAILDARDANSKSTLADMYDPDLMPPNLKKAHNVLDRAVDNLFRRQPFKSERERVEHLFGLYEKMRAPLAATAPKRRRRKRSVA